MAVVLLGAGALMSPAAFGAGLLGMRQPQFPATTTLTPTPVHTSVGIITLQATVPSGATARANKRAQQRLKQANPGDGRVITGVRNPYHGPAIGDATADAADAPPDQGEGVVAGPGTGQSGQGGSPIVRSGHREHATASTTLTSFRVSTVTDPSQPGAGAGPSWTGEPTTANDRNAILYTANWYAAYSSDNGRTWGYVDPATAFPKLDGGFCCDQYAVSIPRDGYNSIAWIMQNAPTTTKNSYRLVILENRSGVESLDGTLEYCSYVIDSTDFGDLPSNYRLDYPAMQVSDTWLYLTANAGSIGGTTVDRSVIWRISLDDIETCGGSAEGAVIEDRTTLRPVNGAGSKMYFGSIPLWSNTYGKKFDIDYVSDSSRTVHYTQKNVTDWPTGTMSCPLTSTTTNDPCARLSGLKVLTGYQTSTRVGWMFVAGTGSSSTDFPYTRVVRFDPSSLALTGESDIWNTEFAWTYPSSGRTLRGDVGGLLVVAGGEKNPKSNAFMVDDVSGWSWSPLDLAAVTSSDEGPNGRCAPGATTGVQCFGDYFTAAAYTGCSNSMLATSIVEQTSGGVIGVAHRWAWFGRERDACVDLQVSGVTAASTSGGAIVGGEQVSLGDTTWNTGATASPSSTTTYFLSRDASLSGADVTLGSRSVGAISAGSSSVAMNQVFSLPVRAAGSYQVIACADEPDTFDEVSDTNNCSASAVFDVQWGAGVVSLLWDRTISDPVWKGLGTPGSRLSVTALGRILPFVNPQADLGHLTTSVPEMIPWDVFLTVDPKPSFVGRLIGRIPTGPIKPIPLPGGPLKQWVGTASAGVRLPTVLPAGRYFIRVCAQVRGDDPHMAANCATAKQPLVIKAQAVIRQNR